MLDWQPNQTKHSMWGNDIIPACFKFILSNTCSTYICKYLENYLYKLNAYFLQKFKLCSSLQIKSRFWLYSFFNQPCSDNEKSLFFFMAHCPSMFPVVEKAQHEPQDPWFLTGVTAPLVRQSNESGILPDGISASFIMGLYLGFIEPLV